MNLIWACLFFLLQNFYADGTCTLPTELNGQWWDSRTNTVTFTQSSGAISGWTFTAFSNTVSAFTCFESDSSHLLFRSDNTILAFGNRYVYICVRYNKITDNSFYYYLDSDVEDNADDERILLRLDGEQVTISGNCNPTAGPGVEEFHVLVQKDRQADVKQWFPEPLLGVFAYSVETSSSTGLCGGGSVWDGCTNRTTIQLNYTQCNVDIFSSSLGNDNMFYATQYFTSGSTSYVIIIDGSSTTTQRFTCIAVSGISASSHPGSCKRGQTATSRVTTNDKSVLISLSAYETCPFTTSAVTSTSNAGTIAAVVVVLLLLVVGAVVGFILYYKCYKKEPFPWQKSTVKNGSEENAEKKLPDNVVEVESMSAENPVDEKGKKKVSRPLARKEPATPNQKQQKQSDLKQQTKLDLRQPTQTDLKSNQVDVKQANNLDLKQSTKLNINIKQPTQFDLKK